MVNIFNFSGGKTSAYMTIKYYKSGDHVIFCDTGREHPATYKFIDDFEKYEGIKVTRIKYYNEANPFPSLLKRKNYKTLPNMMKRFCTVELKIKTCKRYLKSIGIQEFNNFIGFRYDEGKRVSGGMSYYKKVHNIFPLFNDKITNAEIISFWQKQRYSLEIPHILGNCTLCFMKGKNAIINILSMYPELAKPWIEDENSCKPYTYINGFSIERLLNLSKMNLFSEVDLNKVNPAFSCSCSTT